MLFISQKFPLDQVTLAILKSIDGNTKIQGIDYFVIGAMARDIILQHVFEIGPIRATRDIDFAFAVQNWETFDRIKKQLLQNDNRFTYGSNKEPYRLIYTMEIDSVESTRPVDILPFGGVENFDHSILWPPDMDVMMTVMGFSEASRSTVMVECDSSLTIPVASVPGLAMLKLISWMERTGDNRKDAQDFSLYLHKYADLGNMDRLYGKELALLEAAKYDPEKAGARLLGKDVASISSHTTKEKIKKILLIEKNKDLLITHMTTGYFLDEKKIETTGIFLEEFTNGFNNIIL